MPKSNASVTLHPDLSHLLVQVAQLERWINKSALSSTQEFELRQIVNQMLVGALNDETLNVFVDVDVRSSTTASIDTRQMANDFDDYMNSLLQSVPATEDVMPEDDLFIDQSVSWKDGIMDTSLISFEDLTDDDITSGLDFLVDDVPLTEIPDENYVYDLEEAENTSDEEVDALEEDKAKIKRIVENQSYKEVNELSATDDDDYQVGEHEAVIAQKQADYDEEIMDVETNTFVNDMVDMEAEIDVDDILDYSDHSDLDEADVDDDYLEDLV